MTCTASRPTTDTQKDTQNDTPDLSTLKVAYLVNQYPQPSHSFIRREMAALEALGAQVVRFTLRRGTTKLVDPRDRLDAQRTRSVLEVGARGLLIATLKTAFSSPSRFWYTLKLAVKLGRRSDRGLLLHLVYLAEACVLLKWLSQANIAHVHAHFGTNSTTVAMFCRLLGGPTYSFTVHGPEEFDKSEFLHLGTKVAHSSLAVTVSEFGRSQLCRWAALSDWSKIQVVHCGVDALFHDAPCEPPPVEPRLVCVARLHEQKGLPVLIEAAARLKQEGRSFKVNIIGDGSLREVLQRQIDEHGLNHFVRLLGWRSNDDVQSEILAARAMVLPSFAEGLPVVIMEALALHRPVISSYVAGIPELVKPGENGWLVPAGAVEPLVEAMREALDAKIETLVRMGQHGAECVARQHNALVEAGKLGTHLLNISHRS